MSSSPSARHTEHFYDVLSRLPSGTTAFFQAASTVLLSCLFFFCESYVKLSFYPLTFICRSQVMHTNIIYLRVNSKSIAVGNIYHPVQIHKHSFGYFHTKNSGAFFSAPEKSSPVRKLFYTRDDIYVFIINTMCLILVNIKLTACQHCCLTRNFRTE